MPSDSHSKGLGLSAQGDSLSVGLEVGQGSTGLVAITWGGCDEGASDPERATEERPIEGMAGGWNSLPAPSNTGRASSQMSIRGCTIGGGLDWLGGTLYGKFNYQWNLLKKFLDDAKAAAALDSSSTVWVETPAGDSIKVRAWGSGGQRAKWAFEALGGVRFAIVDRQEEHETSGNVFIDIPGAVLGSHSAAEAFASVLGLLAGLGFCYSRSVASRADVCVDIAECGVVDLTEAMLAECGVLKARRFRLTPEIGECWRKTGFSVSAGEVKVRVYDKLLQALESGCPIKWRQMIQNRWGGVEPSKAMRVECQVRGRTLRSMKVGENSIESIEDVIQNAGGILAYCVEDWLRITATKPDRSNHHQGRCETHADWLLVQEAVRLVYECGSGPAVRSPRPVSRPSAEGQRQQLVGAITSAAANAGVRNWAGLIAFMRGMLAESRERMLELLGRKRSEYLSAGFLCEAADPWELDSFAWDDEFAEWWDGGEGVTVGEGQWGGDVGEELCAVGQSAFGFDCEPGGRNEYHGEGF